MNNAGLGACPITHSITHSITHLSYLPLVLLTALRASVCPITPIATPLHRLNAVMTSKTLYN